MDNQIIILGDLHFGSRRNSKIFHEILKKELTWFLSKIKKDDTVIILGDIFDSRSSVDFIILNDAWDFFIQLSRSCKSVFIVAGNHDEYYKDFSRETTNCRFLEFKPGSDSNISPVRVITEIEKIDINGKQCLFVPWVDKEEKLEIVRQACKTHLIDFVFGHWDSIGLYNNDDLNSLAFTPSDFPKTTKAISGHYHKRLQKENIYYVGSFINTTFNDVDEIKGYHILTDDLEFVPNNCPTFRYLTIDNPITFIKSFNSVDSELKTKMENSIRGNFIKIFLNEYKKENDEVYNIIKSMNPIDIFVSFNKITMTDKDVIFEGFDSKVDISSVLIDYVDKIKEKITDVSIDSIKNLIQLKNNEYKQNMIG